MLLGAPLAAQPEAPVDRFDAAITVREVLLDVVVTDRRGRPVPGLTMEDFVVLEEGREVEITGLDYRGYLREAGPDEPTWMSPLGPGVALAAHPQPRYFVMLFHDLMRGDGQTMGVHTRRVVASMQSRRWIETALEPGDFVAILTYDSRLRVRQDFTRDRTALREVLASMILRGDPDDRPGAATRGGQPGLGAPSSVAPASIGRYLPVGDDLRDASTSLGRALVTLARALRPIEGRKHLLFYTIGVGVVPGETLVDQLNRSNVDVYTIDLTPPQAQHLQSVALRAMARDTDGEYYPNGGSFLHTLRHIDRRANDYYQLAYLRREDGEPARIEVRTKDPKLRVVTRRRFAN